jgi:hypothetical protein
MNKPEWWNWQTRMTQNHVPQRSVGSSPTLGTSLDNCQTHMIEFYHLLKIGSIMITVGSQFTTAKSGVTGTVKEIVKNDNGTSRVRLDVNGKDRWTTVKGV